MAEVRVEEIISTMEREAKRRKAPVYSIPQLPPFWRLAFIMLSSRTKDEATIKAIKRLLSAYRDERDLCRANVEEVSRLIYGVGFYRTKAKKLKALACIIAERGLPTTYEELVSLPGVGEKTANVFLSANGEAIGVDVHVHRIANRLGLVSTSSPKETEAELRKTIPKHLWRRLNKAFVGFGQTVCKAKPKCDECPLKDICPSSKAKTPG